MTRPLETSIDLTLPFGTDPLLRRRFSIVNEPVPANLRWGRLLEVLDKLAEDVALTYVRRTDSEARVVTAAVDDIVLHIPADVEQDLNLHARINYVGRSSMEVGIRVDQNGAESLASCYFTMVARTGTGDGARNIAVEPLVYTDAIERFRRDAAIARRRVYRSQRAALHDPPSPTEYQLLGELHAAQEAPDFRAQLAGGLVRSTWERMYPEQENVPEKIFGGHLVRRAFELAYIHAEEIAAPPHRPVVARVNRINFLQPVRIGDKLHYTSRVVYTGETSICVEISIERVSLDRVTKALSNTCVFTFVSVDSDMRPQPVPKIYPTTYAEDARYLEAHRRRMTRVAMPV